MFSLDRYKTIGNLGSSIFRERGPGGFIDSYSAPDEQTVVINFTEQLAWALNWLAPFGGYTSTMMMVPRESGSDYNPDQKAIGTGPFMLTEHEPSVRITLERNPDYWDPDWALIDKIEMPIVPEYATRQAQYKAGAIHWARETTLVVRPTDVLAVMGDQPKLNLYQGNLANTGSVLTYGIQTLIDGKNPYADERVRQAISMAYDRDLDNDVQFNVSEFEEAGLPVTALWNSHLAQRESFTGGGWVLDPRDEATFGENAKYFQYNIEEAKALLSAAGYPDGFDVDFRYPHAAAFSRETRVEPLFFYLQEIGLNVIQSPMTDYTQDYIPNNRDASGAYSGIGFHSITGTVPSVVDPSNALVAEHHPDAGVTFHGYNDGKGDAALTEILNKMKREMDVEARVALNHEAQRHLAQAQWCLLEAGTATGMVSAWPAVGNFRVWNASPSTWRTYQIFIDDTLPPNA
jgi:ABC-type transport system substrate-binding protein